MSGLYSIGGYHEWFNDLKSDLKLSYRFPASGKKNTRS
jgi:hypothetical protein